MTLDELRALATGTRDGVPCWEGELGAMAVTLPEAEFIYALVRMVQPLDVLEFGSGYGISSLFIASALDGGCLTTVEWDPFYRAKANEMLVDVPALVEPSDPGGEFGIVYIDSAPRYRSRRDRTVGAGPVASARRGA